MFGHKKRRLKHARLSAEARAWETEQLRALGLADVVWDAEVCCRRCRSAAELGASGDRARVVTLFSPMVGLLLQPN